MLQIKTLSKEQSARFPEWCEKWLASGLSTERTEWETVEQAVLGCYKSAKLKRPLVLLRLGSPWAVSIGGVFATRLLKNYKVLQQVEQQVEQQVGQQVLQQVLQQVWQQVEQQVEQQVGQQVWQQVEQQVWQQVEQQVWQQVLQQVEQQVEQQVWQQVEQQVWQQVWQQFEQQVEQQVWQQVGQQVLQQVEQQVWQQFEQQVWQQVNNYWGGQFWSSWYAYVSFFRDVCNWSDDSLELFALGEGLQSAGWIWWHDSVCAISDRPTRICLDSQHRLHSSEGQAIEYPDGWGMYVYHGVRVPEQVILKPETLTDKQIIEESNAEVRRVMIERFGLDRFLSSPHAKPLHSDQDGKRQLLRFDLTGDEPVVGVKVTCPTTGQVYFLRVPPQIDRCDKAVAWTFGYDKVMDYQPVIET